MRFMVNFGVVSKIEKPARSGGENCRSGWLHTLLIELLLRGNITLSLVDSQQI
jgi:hypothetical protein